MYIVYTGGLKWFYNGSPLGPKYILCTYMDLFGGFWVSSLGSTVWGVEFGVPALEFKVQG